MSVVTQTSNKTFRLVGSLCSVASIVLGIPCLFISFAPLFGAVVFYPSLLAFALACVGLYCAIKAGTSTGASITGLVITLFAVWFSWAWLSTIKSGLNRPNKHNSERSR